MTLPKDISKLNLTNEEYEKLSDSDKLRIAQELPMNSKICFSEIYKGSADLSKTPCIIDGLLIY